MAGAALLMLCAACQNDDTDFSSIINGQEEQEEYVPRTIEFDYTALSEGVENIPSEDDDYVENAVFSHQVNVAYDGNTATLSGDDNLVSVATDGAHVVINSTARNVEYVISGASDNGSFKIYSKYKFKLTLGGVRLTNPNGAAINNQCGKSMYVELAAGTTNSLADGSAYIIDGSEDMKGTFFSEGQILFSGSGTLNIEANYKNAIASDDYILFRPGNIINVTSNSGNGVKANDGVAIKGGVLNIEVLAAGGKGINSEADIDIMGGRTTIITSADPYIADGDTSSCAAIKCDSTLTMTAGTVMLKSEGEGGKGVNCDMDVLVSGGELAVVALGKKGSASPKGIKADGAIAFTGGSIYSYSKESDAIDAAGQPSIAAGYKSLTDEQHLFEVEY